MRKEFLLLGSVAGLIIAAGLGYAIVRTMNNQRDTQRQLDDLKRQIADSRTPAATAPGASIILGGAATQNGSELARQKATHDVLAEGYRLLNTRDPRQVETAVTVFQEGISRVDDRNAQFYSGLGRSLLVLGRYQQSIDAFARGQKLDPALSELFSGQAWAYWNLKDYPAARDKWEQALKLDPKSIDALSAMAWIYLALGQRDQSLAAFNVLIFSGSDRNDWKIGRNMAAAGNTDIQQIRVYFPVPDPSAFTRPATGPR